MKKLHVILCTLLTLSLPIACDHEKKGDEPDKTGGEAAPGFVAAKVLDYRPAPGQFVGEMPQYKPGMTAEQMTAAADASIAAGELVSLGAWGGTIVYRLEKYITNGPGADFRVVGNAYYTRVIDGVQYGNSEPGIVYVMKDENGNGLPDETWYELEGSHSAEARDAIITYSERAQTEDTFDLYVSGPEIEDEHWTTNPEYHPHSYMPVWLGSGALTYRGRMLPANGRKLADNGQYSQIVYTGYADSQPNNKDESSLDISTARDASGRAVSLDRIDFIKVQTAVLQFNGPIGECSTEVGRIQAL